MRDYCLMFLDAPGLAAAAAAAAAGTHDCQQKQKQ
jgi:hypothetical protein